MEPVGFRSSLGHTEPPEKGWRPADPAEQVSRLLGKAPQPGEPHGANRNGAAGVRGCWSKESGSVSLLRFILAFVPPSPFASVLLCVSAYLRCKK